MPKTVKGIYIKTERSLKKLIEIMNSKSKTQIILKDIDEYSCIINGEGDIYKKVMEEIDNCQKKYLFDDQHLEEKEK